MKKLKRVVLVTVIILGYFFYLQFGREVEIRNTRITSYQNGYSEDVSIIANKLYIADKDKFAKDVIDTFMDNSFNDVKLSFDLGYPSDLNILVYMNEWNDKEAFKIFCVFDFDNLKGKPYCFKFEIRETVAVRDHAETKRNISGAVQI